MDRKKKIRILVGAQIVSALTWAVVIVGCSHQLEGTGGYEQIFNILIVGASTHFLLISSLIAELLPGGKKDNPPKVV
ncbi:hypothetical protein QQ008_15005 [Fulvivirgaceae bacterium BMA10]|uniref:Uncharacterized protein n=1 Tax=Splendidivirga corallicola TaxID=3051826 RepID=A0ABT8KPN7_9BACT|nr:hypothetical protein [Fulvivirgaceae bacterium BMA10]